MHLFIACGSIFAAWKWGNWRNWKQYHSTLLYMMAMAMMYEFFTKDYMLWRFHPDILMNQTIVIAVYAIVTMPLNTLNFLSSYPTNESKIKVFLYYAKWIAIYLGVELILYLTKRITYQHHWNLWWSCIFDCIMFPMLRLHHVRPLMTYVISFVIVAAYISVFKVPLK